MNGPKQVWLKDGKLQTYDAQWQVVGEGPTPTPTHVTGVELDQHEVSLGLETTLQLTATVSPEDATDKRVTWSSSNNAVATVNSQGLVSTGTTEGEAVITVKTRDGNFTDTCAVAVSSYTPEVQEIALSGGAENISGYANRGTGFGVKITPYTASNVHFTAVSSDPSVFEVTAIDYSEFPDEYQIGSISLRFVGEGEATLTLTSEDNPSVTASYPVIVNPDVRVESISNPSSLSAEAYAYGQKNNIITFNYSPTNAVLPNEDIMCSIKEGETSIGYAWISKISDGVAGINFSGEAAAGSSAVYELYAVDDPTSKYEITITLVEAVTSLTLGTHNLSMNAGESDVSVGFTYSPVTADLDSVHVESRGFQEVELVKDSDGVGHLAITSDANQQGDYPIRLASSSWVGFDELLVSVQQVPVSNISSSIPNSFDLTDDGERKSYTVAFLPSNASNPIRDITIEYVSGDGDEVYYSPSVTAQGVLTLAFHCEVIGTYVYSLDLNGESQQQITINCVSTPQTNPITSVSNLSANSVSIVEGQQDSTITFDYLPVDADDDSTVTFVYSDDTVTSADITGGGTGTAQLTIDGLAVGTSRISIYVGGVDSGLYIDVTVTPVVWTVTATVNDGTMGSVSPSSMTDIPDNVTITTQNEKIVVGNFPEAIGYFVPTAETGYHFVEWQGIPVSHKVTQDITITAVFAAD